ncbi:MAG: Fe-S-containing hydro-lyase [Deltaproteobacteria bacterium]|nr:Fe-S-containing hydro-lyase [Deltaproteobacteria bacterium]
MTQMIRMTPPLAKEDVIRLNIGDKVLLSGVIYTARDAAHKRLYDLIQKGEELPIMLEGQVIYYVGPSPALPGRAIGAAGPTTSYRMDPYAPTLIANGLRAMIGKGKRSKEVIEAMKKHSAVYLAAVGGAGALMSQSILEAKIVAYPELGPEAVWRFVVKDFPAIVVNDVKGNDLYMEGVKQYQRT